MEAIHLSRFNNKDLLFLIIAITILSTPQLQHYEGNLQYGAFAAIVIDTRTGSSIISGQQQLTPPRPPPPPRVKLNKCCHYGEYLDASKVCVAGSTEHWVPLIYLINRKTYYTPQGESPKFITFEENVRPIITKQQQQQIENDNGTHADTVHDGCTADNLELYTGSDNLVLFSNGSLFLREHERLLGPQRFCVDHKSALVCFPSEYNAAMTTVSRRPRVKVKKCCGRNGSYDPTKKVCTFATAADILALPLNMSIYQTTYGFPECKEALSSQYIIIGDWQEALLQDETGNIVVQGKAFNAQEFCLEHLRENNETTDTKVKIFACLHHFTPNGGNGFSASGDISSNGHQTTSDRLQTAVLNIGIVISVVFLGATLIAGYMMPSVHHVLHWRCQIYYVFCLFVGDLLFAYMQLSHSFQLGSTFCLMLASAMHFFFLAAFFWLNTMCFNIWWTFRDFRPSSLERNQELLRLRLYSAYAWGIPLLFTAIAACIDQIPDTQLLRPGFGELSCWFNGERLSIFAYFFGPVGLLLCANIILFVSTTHQLTCGLWKRDDVKSTTEKTALGKVCLKLVVVMGVTWIADVISWLIGGPHSIWFFTDLINALQGVFIFVVVGCQPQVWSACKRFCCRRSRQEITNTTNGVQHSSSSQGLPSMAACGAEITQNTSVNTTIGVAAMPTQAKIPMETVC